MTGVPQSAADIESKGTTRLASYNPVLLTTLHDGGKYHGTYTTGRSGYLKTLFIMQGRAFGNVIQPWLVVTLITTIWTVVFHVESLHFYEDKELCERMRNYSSIYTYAISTTLSFLLTFRVNRGINRFWVCMKLWGDITSKTRSFVSAVLIHGYHADKKIDTLKAVSWIAAFPVAVKEYIRYFAIDGHNQRQNDIMITHSEMCGFLTEKEVNNMLTAIHPALYAANEIRYHLKRVFVVTNETKPALSPARSSEMRQNEAKLDSLLHDLTLMEYIGGNPIPVVFVSHLRTFLILYLLSLGFLKTFDWGWATIPFVSMISFMLLGLDSAAAETEVPFEKGHVNDLNLDWFCWLLMEDIMHTIDQVNEQYDRGAFVYKPGP